MLYCTVLYSIVLYCRLSRVVDYRMCRVGGRLGHRYIGRGLYLQETVGEEHDITDTTLVLGDENAKYY